MRDSMYRSWKLRGGICCPEDARKCFDWEDQKAWQDFLRNLASIRVTDGQCILSELDEDLKRHLKSRWSWILKWASDGSRRCKSILVGKQVIDFRPASSIDWSLICFYTLFCRQAV